MSTKYYIKNDEDTFLAKTPYWGYINKINYDNSNFYFLMNNFFNNRSNFTSLSLNFFNSNLTNYDGTADYKKFFPSSYYHFSQDTSFLNDFLYVNT